MPDESNPSPPTTPAMPPPPMPTGYASDSGWPRRSKHFQPEPGGFYASNRVWAGIAGVILTIITGGVSYSGWQLVTRAQLDERTVEIKSEAKEQVKTVGKQVKALTVKVGNNTSTLQAVQKVQHQDIAYREARRVVGEAIHCRRGDNGCQRRRDNELERVRKRNMERLQAEKPRPPCADLACTN